jgi:hypothetical protein
MDGEFMIKHVLIDREKRKRNLLQWACQTGNKNWSMKQTLRSKLYTTDIRDIIKIKI